MKVVIRVDASTSIGSGYVMRCVTLAEALISIGYDVYIVCRPQLGDLISFIQARNICVVSLLQVPSLKPATHSSDYIGWLKVSVADDAKKFSRKSIGCGRCDC